MTEDTGIDRRLGHHVTAGGVVTLLGLHLFDFGSVAANRDVRPSGDVVWTIYVRHAVEAKLIAARSHRVAHIHVNVFLRLVSGDERDADNKHRDTKMRDLHPIVTTRLRA